MSDQTVSNTPAEPSNQNNLVWMIVAGLIVLFIIMFVVFGSGNNSANEVLQTPVPQNPQLTQVPQETQVPQNPQDTQIPQNPQSTQVPQPTSVPLPTVQL